MLNLFNGRLQLKTHFEGKLQASAKGISISEMPTTDGRNERLLPVL